jgi:hypothetical protein
MTFPDSLSSASLRRWYDEYVEVFAAAVRGEAPVSAVLGYYAAPVLYTSDDGVTVAPDVTVMSAVMQSQIDVLRSYGYAGSDVTRFEASTLNATTALLRVTVTRRDARGHEIETPAITYVVADGGDGPRFAVLAAHGG